MASFKVMIALMTQVRILPRDEGPIGWETGLPPRTPKPQLEGEMHTEWAVLGAGFTGLAAARRLAQARPDDRIAVVDALEVGDGASGRNSGFAIDHAHTLGGGAAVEENARGQKRLYTAAINQLHGIVEQNKISCDWRVMGKIHAAVSARGADKYLCPLLDELDHIGEEHEWLDRAAIKDITGMAHYEAGIYTPGTALLNPVALVRGLADTLPSNVKLYERSPVTGIERGDRITLVSDKGRIVVRKLVVAGNAYLPALGFAPNRLMPFVAFASLSASMTEAQRAALGGKDTWGLTPANAFVAPTLRRTGDHRILFREQIIYRPELSIGKRELTKVRERHKKLFAERFPMLEDLELAHTWGGYLCLSRNQDSLFGPLGDHVWATGGFQGNGVTRGTAAGTLLADLAMGLDNPLLDDMMRIARPPENPPRPFFDVGIFLRTAWEAWAERDEK